jgi:hypothetical protein
VLPAVFNSGPLFSFSSSQPEAIQVQLFSVKQTAGKLTDFIPSFRFRLFHNLHDAFISAESEKPHRDQYIKILLQP